jgi:hypothetical protein
MQRIASTRNSGDVGTWKKELTFVSGNIHIPAGLLQLLLARKMLHVLSTGERGADHPNQPEHPGWLRHQ